MAEFVRIVCTKCGKSNEVEYSGRKLQIRCVGCGGPMTVGGQGVSVKALPTAQIGVVLGILFLGGAGFAAYSYVSKFLRVDPMSGLRTGVLRAAEGVVAQVAVKGWAGVQLRYATAIFTPNSPEARTAWAKLGYEYADRPGAMTYTVEFPIKFVRKGGSLSSTWEPSCAGIFSPEKAQRLREQAQAIPPPEDAPPIPEEDLKPKAEEEPEDSGCDLSDLPKGSGWEDHDYFPYDLEKYVDYLRGARYLRKTRRSPRP